MITQCKVHSAHFDSSDYPKGCPMCVRNDDAVSDLLVALKTLYSEPYWSEATEAARYADDFSSAKADMLNLTSKLKSLLAGIREDANERARAA